MAQSIVVRSIGPTYALSVTASQHAAVGIVPLNRDICNFAAFTNSGATDICITWSPYNTTPATEALVFPVDGTPTIPNSFIIRAATIVPVIIAVPANGFCLSAIGSGAGPSILYVTPVGDQS